jgi:hypothetical protein
VTALNPDGSVATSANAEGESNARINGNPWDEVLSHEAH